MVSFTDEALEAYFNSLGKSEEAYARNYWRFLQGVQPDHKQHGIRDRDAQQIRIRLATFAYRQSGSSG